MNQSIGRIITALVLLTSLAFMITEIVTTWRTSTHVTVPPVTKKKKKAGPRQRPKNINFYPSVPSPMPDLYKGYLFNEQRLLLDPEKEVEEKIEEKGVDVDLDSVMYSGSIIIGDLIKGMISYPQPKQARIKEKAARTKNRKNTKRSLSKKRLTKIVEPGDIVGGFRISSIVPEKIVFTKGKEQVEKILYDPEKKRIVVPKTSPRPRKTAKKKAAISKRKRVTTTSRKPLKNRKVVRSR